MIVVQDIIGEVEQVTGRCDQAYLFAILTRAVETLARKACAISVTFDPLLIYVDLPVQQDYFVFLPYQVEKPIKINLNGEPAFSHSSLYEFAQNGPGSQDLEAGWQWQDRLTSPIQRRFPRGPYALSAMSDSEADENLQLQCKVRFRDRSDHVIDIPIAPSGTTVTKNTQQVYNVLEVVKPISIGTVTLYAGPVVLAHYYPEVTLPEFSCIKLSQRAVSVRMIARRKTLKIQSLLDVIPLNSSQAVIMQCQAIKFYDEIHYDLAQAAENQAVTYLNEEQAARNQYSAASATEVGTALNLTIGQRDTIIIADIYDHAARIFGFVGRAKLLDSITSTLEILYNKCQYWDQLTGVVTLRADDDYYVALPRYVDTILALNVNRHIGAYKSPWFEFSYAGSGEFGDLYQDETNWQPWPQLAVTQGSTFPYGAFGVGACGPSAVNGSNRLAKGWEEVGTTCLAFRLKGPSQLLGIPEVGADNGTRLTIYGYDQDDNPVLDSRGEWGVDLPCYTSAKPGKQIFRRIERITKDPTYGFVQLYALNPYTGVGAVQPIAPGAPPPILTEQQTVFLSLFWPWDTEPQYRLIRMGVMCKRVRVRYKKNWAKFTQLTDPIHCRSREAIILAMTAVASMRTGGTTGMGSAFVPTAGVQIAMDQLNLAVDMLDDEWRARYPHSTISLQWPTTTYGNAFPQIM